MLPEVTLRLLISLAVIGIGWILFLLANRMILARTMGKVHELTALTPGVPAILYFTTPDCAPCKLVQEPAIRSLKKQLGDVLQVIEVDASTHPDLAGEWGVMSVPTTFLIDARGRPRVVNHGLATKEKLFQQLREINQ
jgi:thioredoxin 1